MKEQIQGVNLNTWYPNTWIEKIDENGNPIDDHEPFDGVDYPPIGGVFPEAPVKYPR